MADTFSTNPLLIGKTDTVQAPPLMPVPGTAVAPTPERPSFNIFSPEGSALLAQLGGVLSPEGNAFTAGLAGVANQSAQGALQSQYMEQLRQDPQAQVPRFMDPKVASQTQDKAQGERQERLDFMDKIFKLRKQNMEYSRSPDEYERGQRFIDAQIDSIQRNTARATELQPGILREQEAKLAGLQGDLAIQTATQKDAIAKVGLENQRIEAQIGQIKALENYYNTGQQGKANTIPFAAKVMGILPKYITPDQKELINAGILKGDYTTLFQGLKAEDQPKVMQEIYALAGVPQQGISAGLPGAPQQQGTQQNPHPIDENTVLQEGQYYQDGGNLYKVVGGVFKLIQ